MRPHCRSASEDPVHAVVGTFTFGRWDESIRLSNSIPPQICNEDPGRKRHVCCRVAGREPTLCSNTAKYSVAVHVRWIWYTLQRSYKRYTFGISRCDCRLQLGRLEGNRGGLRITTVSGFLGGSPSLLRECIQRIP